MSWYVYIIIKLMNISITPKVSFWVFLELLCIPPSHLSMSPPCARAITDLIYIKFCKMQTSVRKQSPFVFITDIMKEKSVKTATALQLVFLFWVTSGSPWWGYFVQIKEEASWLKLPESSQSLWILYKGSNKWMATCSCFYPQDDLACFQQVCWFLCLHL